MMCSADRRHHPRYPLPAGVRFVHGPSQRQFPGRCVDVSEGGLSMYVPAGVPVQPGQPIRLTLGKIDRPEIAALGSQSLDATVVRVDRKALLSRMGHLAVAVRFVPPEQA